MDKIEIVDDLLLSALSGSDEVFPSAFEKFADFKIDNVPLYCLNATKKNAIFIISKLTNDDVKENLSQWSCFAGVMLALHHTNQVIVTQEQFDSFLEACVADPMQQGVGSLLLAGFPIDETIYKP